MATTDIGWVGLAASLVLVAVAIGLSWWRRLALETTLAWAATRAVVQLLAVGFVLEFVFAADRSIAWSWAWVVVMVAIAAETVQRRVREVDGLFPLAVVAFAAAATVALGLLFGLAVFPVEPRTIVPAAGLVIGNSMAASVLVVRRTLDELSRRRDEVEARLALGLTGREATDPAFRDAMRTALTPQIESTKVVGLIALPGAMTGLILAGVAPIDAVRVQAAVMFLILGAVATVVTVIGLGVRRRLVTTDHRLALPAASPASGSPSA